MPLSQILPPESKVLKMGQHQVWILPDEKNLARTAADVFLKIAQISLLSENSFTVMLSGGSTPKKMDQILASDEFRNQIPWEQSHIFWSDERMVPFNHAESNFHLAWENLLKFVPIPSHQIHRVRTELGDSEIVAKDYEKRIRNVFFLNSEVNTIPQFNLIVLGMGEDGHTASLFPGISLPSDHSRLITSNWIPHLNSCRISILPSLLLNAEYVVFLVSGESKAQTLKIVLESTQNVAQYPAQWARSRKNPTLWIVDQSAGSQLDFSELHKAA